MGVAFTLLLLHPLTAGGHPKQIYTCSMALFPGSRWESWGALLATDPPLMGDSHDELLVLSMPQVAQEVAGFHCPVSILSFLFH